MLNVNDDRLQLPIPLSSSGRGTSNPAVSTFPGFVRLGVKHIWTGYDHLLFLSALLLVCRNFKSAVQVVTCFTLAHSLTLAFATLNLVWVSSRVVEPTIAASIIYVGVENLFQPEGPKGRWLITFLFGLVHGLGFATVLRDMGISSSTTGVALPLVGFNLGVEAGQLAVACLLLPLISKLRNFEPFLKRGIPACSATVAVAGCYWFAQRVFFA
jgi:hydrogenase/urease accessory protein HupE